MITLIAAILQELQAIQQKEAQIDVDKAEMEALKGRQSQGGRWQKVRGSDKERLRRN
jgi:hypothetical protein